MNAVATTHSAAVRIGLAAWFWAVVAFLFAPLAVVVLFSFNAGELSVLPIRGLTTRWYGRLADNAQILESLRNSLLVAGATVVLSCGLGVPLAIGTARLGRRTRRAALAFAAGPMMLPRLILGVSLITFFSLLDLRLSLWTVILGHSLIGIPYVTLIVSARLADFDVRLEEAAFDLGAGPVETLRTVTLPLLGPAIGAGALIAFTLSFDDVVVAFFTTGIDNTLPMTIWSMLRFGITPELNALASATLAVSAVAAVLSEVAIRASRPKPSASPA